VKFPWTIVDVTLLQHLCELLKSVSSTTTCPCAIQGGYESAHLDAFRIRVNLSHYIQPTGTEVLSHLTPIALQERKATHNFLLQIVESLRQLQSVARAGRNILQLPYRFLAHSLFSLVLEDCDLGNYLGRLHVLRSERTQKVQRPVPIWAGPMIDYEL
jgi:hypothetical protein